MSAPRGPALADQAGFSLVELLVATMMAMIVLGAAVMVFTSAITSQPDLSRKNTDIQTARTSMERIVRELRLGSSVSVATSSQLRLVTWVNTATCGGSAAATIKKQCVVTYTCAGSACTRTEAPPAGGTTGPAVTVVTGLSSPNVFTYTPSATAPTYITVGLTFPAAHGDDAITLKDAAALRNTVIS
jgi:type II secretory pathway pseudopilin PulG